LYRKKERNIHIRYWFTQLWFVYSVGNTGETGETITVVQR